jgi:hypothetical protein
LIGHEAIAALVDPFHLASRDTRGPQNQNLFGVHEILRAEATADILRDNPDIAWHDPERHRYMIPRGMKTLG